jgi:hypothetical protein
MKYLNTKRLCWLLAAAALIGWSLHFYKQWDRPTVGWFEATFGSWSMLPIGVVYAVSRLRAKTIGDEPIGFYKKGAGRYFLVALTVTASFGLLFLGLRAYP